MGLLSFLTSPIYPLINGQRASWCDIEFRIGGPRTIGIQGIDYAPSQDPQYVYGAGVEPIGRTRGQVKPEASLTLLKEEFDILIAALAAQGAPLGLGFGEVPFDIVVNYRMDGIGTGQIHTDQVIGCRITKPAQSYSQGSEALAVKLDLNPMRVLLAGLPISGKGFVGDSYGL